MTLFPFAEYWWFYAGFTLFVLMMLALDLGVFHRHAHAVSFREAATWSVVWVTLALLFNYGFYQYVHWKFLQDPAMDAGATASRLGLEFLAGYLIEKSLSVDNIFIFVLVFQYFAIPKEYQHRVLFFGILGALVFRAIFIAIGSVLVQYHWMLVIFGIFLILTGAKMLFAPEQGLDPEKNPLIKLFRRYVPVTDKLFGDRFFVRAGGAWHATPLLIVLLFVEATDIIFAIDSVPAVFAITSEPLIVFTSNIFAILGLRALYFLLAGAIGKFHMLKYGLALVLIFVGAKMAWLNDLFGGKFPIGWSLGIIAGLVGASIVASLLIQPRKPPSASGEVVVRSE